MKTIAFAVVLITVLFKINVHAQDFKNLETKNLKIQVYNASESAFGVASVIISGKTDAVLIDTQFTLEDAEKVAQEIRKSGKKLTTIYISYGDPDYYFGLEVFKKYFPEVKAYATPATLEHIKATVKNKLVVWGKIFGNKITSDAIIPEVIKGSSIDLEGRKLNIIGLKEFPSRTFVWIPSVKAVVGGINTFGTTFHVWTADTPTKESRKEWINVLNKIESLHPLIVVPGHAYTQSSFDLNAVKHTRNYLRCYEKALKNNKTSATLIGVMKAEYPTLTFENALQIGAKVNTGEMKW